jgi:nucleoid-associated protein YgaU
MFATGVMAGILITAAFFLLMFGKQIFTPLATTPGVPVQSNNPMTAPVETLLRAGSSTPDAAPEAPGQTGQGPTTSSGNAPTGSKIVLPGERGGTVPSGGALGTLKGAASYEVQSGDTLSSIAGRVYGDSSPAMVQRIQKANQMANPHALSLGQKLIIPPKEY